MADAISVTGPVTGTDKTLSFETGKNWHSSPKVAVVAFDRRDHSPRHRPNAAQRCFREKASTSSH